MTTGKKIAIVLPAYNEAGHIGAVLDDLMRNLPFKDAAVVAIDDGSTDETTRIIQEKNIHLIQHRVNKGLGQTFRTAVDWCLGEQVDIMVFFDADGQFAVSDIPRVVQPLLDERCDFILGSRFAAGKKPTMPWVKYIGNTVLAWFISWATGVRVHDIACGFRAYSHEALLRVNVSSRFTYTQEVVMDLLFKGLSVVEVPISVQYFRNRNSAISSNLWKYGWRVFKIIMKAVRDYKPMYFFGTVGGVLFIVGIALDIWMMVYFLQTGKFSPYKIVGFGGAFLNFLGITIWFIGLVADMLNRIRFSQEETLYRVKSGRYKIQS